VYKVCLSIALAGLVVLPTPSLAKKAKEPKEPTVYNRHLSPKENVCRALGWFALNRAGERDTGLPMSEVLIRSREWDQANGVEPAARDFHDALVYVVYSMPTVSPPRLQQLIETYCLTRGAQALQSDDPNAWALRRY
jgi:hypothetical protein